MIRSSHWIAGLMLACAANAGGTCLIVIVEKDRVILAGDGLETHRGAAPKTTCKIAAGPHAAIAIRGAVANANTGLDLPAMARKAAEAADGGDTAAAAFAVEVGQALQQELDVERSRAPGIYLERLGIPWRTSSSHGSNEAARWRFFSDIPRPRTEKWSGIGRSG